MQKNDDPCNMFFQQRKQCENCEQPQGKNAKPPDYDQKVAEMKRLAEKYKREGEGQLVQDILNSVIEQKAMGNLSNDQLISFAKRISPLLNNEQRSRLQGLLEQLLQL